MLRSFRLSSCDPILTVSTRYRVRLKLRLQVTLRLPLRDRARATFAAIIGSPRCLHTGSLAQALQSQERGSFSPLCQPEGNAMNTKISAQRLEIRLLTTALVIASLPLFAALASAQDSGQTRFTDPAEIDRAVEQFTGSAIGEVGGARLPADRRLKLATCETPLSVKWHGRAQTIVRVDCPISRESAEGWRVFIATSSAKPAAEISKVVARGDPITVLVRGRGFTVQQSAEAMEAGAIGDWIAVRTERRADAIRARIERPGLAVIPAG